MLMHIEARVKLPDHDYVVAERHKLIPSVYTAITITPNGLGNPAAVTYSGLTYVAIHSGKHSSSTAFTHCLDFKCLITIESFKEHITVSGTTQEMKPVVVICVYGGSDGNPRFQKTITSSVHYFKNHNLYCLIIVCNAPGRSAFH